MTTASRIRKVREICGWKQTAIASSMNITLQGYSALEQAASNARLETRKRFCDVMEVNLACLVVVDAPVTAETRPSFGEKNYFEFISAYKRLQQKVEVLDEILKGNLPREVKSIYTSTAIQQSFAQPKMTRL